MGRRDGVAVNYPPALMLRKTAAKYLDMSEAAFEREVAAGRLPIGKVIGGREHWSRGALDAAIAHLMGDTQMPEYEKEFWERYGPQAA